MRILIFGDSIVWGAWDSLGGWGQRIKSIYDKKAVESGFTGYAEVYILGISAETTNGLLTRIEEEIRARVDKDMQVILAIGINDCGFEVPQKIFAENMRKLIELAKKFAGKVVVLGLTPVDEAKTNPLAWDNTFFVDNQKIEIFNKMMGKFARETQTEFVDVMGEFLKREYKMLLTDGLHPNSEGHALIAKMVLEKLG